MPSRVGSKRAFRYLDGRGKPIRDPAILERIEELAIPPAWTDVWIAARPGAKLQATGYDKAGRKQYLYHPGYRAAQEQAKYDRLIRFGEHLPDLRAAMTGHLDEDELDRERVSAVALRLISLGWFRVGSERFAREGTYGVTTLLRRHVEVRGTRIRLSFPSKAGIRVRSELVDEELADAIRGLLKSVKDSGGSIPAVLAITSDPYIVYTSNIFAMLGLRALYFVLSDVVQRFHYLRPGLAAIICFVLYRYFKRVGWL